MGSTYSTSQRIVTNVADFVTGQKRKRCENDEEEINKIIDIAMHTPKKKKLASTAKYIYQELFTEGKNSDVTVRASGQDFHLHKVYLCQSPYFASMFGGSWLETTKKYITIDIVDSLITIDSLKIVFGSLYNDEIILNPLEIVSTLATATMFQLDGIIEKCSEVMLETINPKTALGYYDAACQYGDKKVIDACINWFLVNLMIYYNAHPLSNLKTIPISLMTKLVSHPDLFVMQTEFSVYIMLKYWMYVHLFLPDENILAKDINMYFSMRKENLPFLLTKDGEKFAETFRGLRMHNLISHHMDVELILRDNIVPISWLNPVVLQQWKIMLRINQNEDKGPNDCTDEVFLATSLRCGRTLQVQDRHMWRWTGFHYGMDLLMILEGTTISIKRNHRPEFEQLLSLQTIRNIVIRVTVVTLNEQRQITYHQTSGIQRLTLAKGEELAILSFEKDVTFPIIISANILYTSPYKQNTEQVEFLQTVT